MRKQKNCIKHENEKRDDGTEVDIVRFLKNGKDYAFHRFILSPKGKKFVEVWVLEENIKKFIKVSQLI